MPAISTKTNGAVNSESLARCLWCKKRIGEVRYRLRGLWQLKNFENSLAIWLADDEITDSICPECLEEQKALLTN
jgi:hypothetical protein